jgi:hypothetical protein
MRRVTRAQDWLKHFKIDAKLKKITPEDFTEAMHVMFKATFPEFYQADKQPSRAELEAALDAQRAATAKAIVNAGRKARNEPPLDNIITFNPKKER